MRSCTREPRALQALLVLAAALGLAAPVHAQGCHRGVVGEDTIAWETTFRGTTSFVAPLPPGLVVDAVEGGVLDGDGVRATSNGPIVVRAHQRRDADRLMPPFSHGAQRLVLAADGRDDAVFTPASDAPVERFVGYDGSPELDRRERAQLDATCGPAGRGARVYLEARSFDDLRGTLSRTSDRGGALLVLAGLVLLVALAGGAVVYVRVARRAAIEEVDAMLEQRFRDLEAQGPPPT